MVKFETCSSPNTTLEAMHMYSPNCSRLMFEISNVQLSLPFSTVSLNNQAIFALGLAQTSQKRISLSLRVTGVELAHASPRMAGGSMKRFSDSFYVWKKNC